MRKARRHAAAGVAIALAVLGLTVPAAASAAPKVLVVGDSLEESTGPNIPKYLPGVEVTVNAVKRHPLPPFRRTVGFSAVGALSRKAFGLDAWPSVIGDTVDLRIEAEAVRARNDEPASAPDTPAARDRVQKPSEAGDGQATRP